MSDNICNLYWKLGRSLWQEDIDQFLAGGIDIWSLAEPLPVSRAGVIWTDQGFILEGETKRDDGEDAYLMPVIAGGTVIDLCAFSIDHHTVATRHGNAVALGQDAFFAPFREQEPLQIWRTPESWLRAGRTGVVLLKEGAVDWFSDVPAVIAEDLDHGATLERLLPSTRIYVWLDAQKGIAA
jgi:hypothetical protein